MHEEALAGRAALAGAQERGGEARLGRRVDVGVVEDDHRAVAAELEQHRLARRALRDLLAGLDRADEADRVRPRAAGDLVADDRAGPVSIEKTPAGSSASTMHSASFTEQTEVDDAGAQTTAFPAASAGAISSAGIVYGQFQGVITPTTPRGTR